MGHGGAHSLEMVALTCFINFHFINSLLQSFNTQFSPEYESGWLDEPGTALSRADTLSNAVKTKSVTHEMYITSDKIVLRREAAPSRLMALCLKHGGRERSCCSCRQTERCARKQSKTWKMDRDSERNIKCLTMSTQKYVRQINYKFSCAWWSGKVRYRKATKYNWKVCFSVRSLQKRNNHKHAGLVLARHSLLHHKSNNYSYCWTESLCFIPKYLNSWHKRLSASHKFTQEVCNAGQDDIDIKITS